jgi:putative oxidoreductase
MGKCGTKTVQVSTLGAIRSRWAGSRTKGQLEMTMAEYGIYWRPDFLLYTSIVALVIGAIMLLIGYRIRFGVWLLLLYWLPVTFIVYSFWNDPVTTQRLNAILFMKNIAIAGGLLMIAAHGGGKYSVQRLFVVSKLPHKER